jgi:nucleotide-binding universal stress UspA family protein
MGTRGLGAVKQLLLGSVAERTIRAAACSVLVVQDPERTA